MARIENGDKGKGELLVDPTFGAARVSGRPLDYKDIRNGSHWRAAFRSGAITGAGVVAGAPLFALRWTRADRVMALLTLEAWLVPVTVFTAAQELGVDAIRATAWSVADSAGLAIALASKRQLQHTKDMNESELVDGGDIRIADATLLTAGTRVLDGYPFAIGSGLVNVVNAAAATQYINAQSPYGFRYQPRVTDGEHPLIIRNREGILVRNVVDFPAAGIARLHVTIHAAEVADY